jgi:hypothetical protein
LGCEKMCLKNFPPEKHFFTFAAAHSYYKLRTLVDEERSRRMDATRAAAARGDAVATSQLYDTSDCRAAIARSNLSAWQQLLGPVQFNSEPLNAFFLSQPLQNVLTCCRQGHAPPCIHYVHNPKAGSTFFGYHEGLPHYLNGDHPTNGSSWMCRSIPSTASQRRNHSHGWPDRRDLVFTSVREPIEAAVSAYNELQRRPLLGRHNPTWHRFDKSRLHGWPPPYLAMPCSNRTERTLRFEAFVDAMLSGLPIGREGHHSWPQALKVDYVTRSRRRYDAIVRLEAIDGGTAALAVLANASLHPSMPSAEMRHTTTNGTVGPRKGGFLGTVDWDFRGCADIDLSNRRLLRKLCMLYSVDFACFAYPLPAACLP